MRNPFVQRHRKKIAGVLSCFDRVVITGTLPEIGYTGAMAGFLRAQGVRLRDYANWAKTLRDEIRSHAQHLAEEAGLEIEFIRSHKDFRKEQRVKEILKQRGRHPGWVHIFSAMENCSSFYAWHNRNTGYTRLLHKRSRCLHYYFYFVDEVFGLVYVRVPTWAPFRLQVGFNGHHWLARRLDEAGIEYEMGENAFLFIEDFEAAQRLADRFRAQSLHRRLNRRAKQVLPWLERFSSGYHWCFRQVEYATDVVFRRQADLQPLYNAIVRTAVHSLQADQVATFLGRKLTRAYRGEAGNDFSTRIRGTRIRHQMGPAAIKLYDKLGLVARVECTTNDVSFFKAHRTVQQRDGNRVRKLAPLRKSIYSLHALRQLMHAATQRYLAYIATIDDPDAPLKALHRMSRSVKQKGRSYRGFNLFLETDYRLFLTLVRGEWAISGFQARDLRSRLSKLTPSRCSYLLKRLRTHGLIKKVGRRYKYYLTKLGRRLLVTALHLRESVVMAKLCETHT